MKKTLITFGLLMLMLQQGFSAVNPLLDPSKKSSTIVDIGYNHEKMPVSTTIPKTLIDIPALSREIDKNLLLKDRIVDRKDCLTDDNGFETCPTEMESCQGNLVPNPGTATPHTNTKYTNKVASIANSTAYKITSYAAGSAIFGGEIANYQVNVGNLSYKFYAPVAGNYTFQYQVDDIGEVYIDGVQIIATTGWTDFRSVIVYMSLGEHTIYMTGRDIGGPRGQSLLIKDISGSIMWNARTGQPNVMTTTFVCPTNYVPNGTVGNCKLDYTYYTYSCPSTAGENNANVTWADANAGGQWVGPMIAGGDCGAIGISNGGVCNPNALANPSVPPSDNCVRTSYTCASDLSKDCTKIANGGAVGTNIFSGYQYAAGTATQHSNTLTKNFTCKNNGVYDAVKEACVINKQYVCLKAGYTYNATVGECIADAVCNDYWNPLTSKCESAPIIECSSGFQYNTRTMNCEKKLDCSVGSLNSTTNLCESEAFCGTEPGWRYDSTTMLCYKDLEVVDMLYQPVVPALQKQFTMDEFQHDTLKFDVTWGSRDLDLHASAKNAAGAELYHLSFRNYCANGGCLNHDYTGGGTEEIVIPVAQWKAAGVKTVNMEMHAWDGGTLSSYSATASYTDKDGVKRTFPLVGTAGYLTLITFDLDTFKITYKAPEVVIPIQIINYCDPDPQYQLVNESLCYFDFNRYAICPTGYNYSTTYNFCYKSTGQEVLEARTYQKAPSCQGGGTFNTEKRICELNPTCFNGTMDMTNKVCKINETNTCFTPATAVNGLDYSSCAASLNCASNPYSASCLTCSVPRIAGYDTVCANADICSGGGTQITVAGEAKCKSTKSIDCPEGYVVDPAGSGKCISQPECQTGYVLNDSGTGCKLTYNWSTYTCDSGWQGPVEPGADCNGSCNEDGCWCNMENAPANNCKKLATISTGGTFTTVEKRDMERHIIRGTSFSPEDLGEFRNMECGADCSYYINKITGNGNSICFEKKNGEKKCLPVDDCYFTGEISPNPASPNDFIKSLSLVDQHTLRSNYSLPYSGSCAAGYMLDYKTMTCTKTITSTCRMNGHAGWTGRANGISSLGAGGLKTTVAIVQANGNASYDTNNNWQGFNIATMAIKLSDGYWYLVDSVKDSTGAEVSRGAIPSSIKLLNKAYYQIIDSTNTLPCKVGGVQVNGYCGTNVKITLPGNKMQILGFSDLESLNGLTAVTDNNTFNLNVTIGSNSFPYQGVKKMPIKDLTGLPNLVIEPKYDTFMSNKIDFWDSFVDKDIGFLEFIREVKNEDRADNFVPENIIPYDMLSKGFTVNDYISEANQVLFVKPTATTSTECNTFAAQIGGAIVTTSSFAANTTSFALSRGVGEVGSCSVLTTDVSKAFDFVNFAVRKNIYAGGFNYKCSPYTCLNHECATASCPTETIGGTNMQNGVVTNAQTVTYMGNILPDMLMPTDPAVCIDQICDAKAGDYVRQCGREIGCENRANVTFDSTTNKCLESYCDNGGVLNTSTRSCQVFKCPYGTVENAAGACIKP